MSIIWVLWGLLLPEIAFSAPVTVPDSARPGAIRPEQEERSRIPQADPEVLPAETAGEPVAPERPGAVRPAATETTPEAEIAAEPGEPERPGAVRPEAEAPAEEEAVVKAERPPPVDTVEVPAVIDRPFDVTECPCIIVKQFVITNAEDLSAYGVNNDDVNTLLSEQVKNQPESGYSIGQFQEVADVVRNYYRHHGLILTQVVVPVQTVDNGVVNLEVYVGRLGRVLIEGNSLYSKETLENVFDDLVDKPIVKSEIEAALLRLTDYPGLTVFGVFQPGLLVGTADIVLKVQDEKRFGVSYRVDNHGTRETGEQRFRTIIDWNNPTNGADKLSFAIQQTYKPKNNTYMGLNYERRLFDGTYIFSSFYNKNEFDVGGAFKANQIHSETENIGINFEKSFFRSRVFNFSSNIGLTRKESVTTTAGAQTNIDKLAVFTLGFDYDSVDTFSPFSNGEETTGGGINFGSLEISQGAPDFLGAMGYPDESAALPVSERPSRINGTTNLPASGDYTKFFGTFTRLQTIRKNMSLLYRLEWQFSPDALVPVEQYSVGGPDNVRAFPVAHILWDQAFFQSFEFLFNAPFFADKPAFSNRTWGEVLQFGVFYDMAVGRVNDPGPGDAPGYESHDGAGFGWRFNVPGSIESRIFWAWEIGNDTITGNNRRPQIWGDFTYSF